MPISPDLPNIATVLRVTVRQVKEMTKGTAEQWFNC